MRLPLGDTMFNNVEDMKNVVEIFPTKTLESFMVYQKIFNLKII